MAGYTENSTIKIQCIIITNIIKQKEVYISFKYFS
ncbi:hypothetical protein QG7_2360, partial [Clostridioides difficile CD175]